MRPLAMLGVLVSLASLLPADPNVQVDTSDVPVTGVVGRAYSGRVRASRGRSPYQFSLVAGTLPNGIALNSAGNLTGTPTAAGLFAFTLGVTDRDGDSASQGVVVSILPGPSPPPSITTTSPLPAGTVGSPYSQSLAASAGTPPYRWSGSAPAGLSLSADGIISGTPTTVGSFNFTATLTDAASRTVSRNFRIDVNPPPLTITTASPLSSATAGVAYSQTLATSGGVPPLTWSIVAGQAPAGLALNGTTGAISGTPTTAGTSNFTIQARDRSGTVASQQFAITVNPGQTPPPQNITISTASALPAGTAGAAYNRAIAVVGGTPPYTWSISAGSVPPGLTLIAATGVLSGTANTPGTYTFSAQVRDSKAAIDTKQFVLPIARSVVITTVSPLPNPVFGNDYRVAMAADGGNPPYFWSLSAGSLPNGLAIDAVTGVIAGNPAGVGQFSFTAQVSDVAGGIASRQFLLTVPAPAMPAITLGSVPDLAAAAQQVIVDLNLAAGYPIPITGQINMNFVPEPAIGADDPAVQFSSGGRSFTFNIPANATQPSSPIAFQTGSVAGTIVLQVTLNGTSGVSRSIQISHSAPVIRNLTVVRNAAGFELRLAGLSPSRELTRATVRFTGSGIDTTDVSIPLDTVSRGWYASRASIQFGSQFSLALPFSIQGNASAIQSATVTVSNSDGASSPLSVDLTVR